MLRSIILATPAFALLSAGGATAAERGRGLVLERVVVVMRHGIRAPLPGEVPNGTRTSAPWPQWSVRPSQITAHGARALEIIAAQDRKRLAAAGLVAMDGCLAPGAIRITSNNSERTIASGEAYARGFAPGCGLAVDHRPLGIADPLFEPLRARASAFDATAAVADIERSTGGMAALVRKHAREIALLDRVLGCGGPCVPAAPAAVSPADDGHDIAVAGPIRATSGVAQVLLLEYLEGMPASQVGWGRADRATLRRLGALHAALFAVFTRPPYMAAHQAGPLARRVLQSLASGPRFDVLMGHDTNVTALAAALRIDLKAPGYAVNDVPPGAGLWFEKLRDRRTGREFVRVYYRSQSPDMLRSLKTGTNVAAIKIPGCRAFLCAAKRFSDQVTRQLADPRN